MALPVFNPSIRPSPGSTLNQTIALHEVQFGDGYTLAQPKGINHVSDTVKLNWRGLSEAQMQELDTFFRALGGYKPFIYTPYGTTVAKRWTCKQWTRSFQPPWTFEATIVETHSLRE